MHSMHLATPHDRAGTFASKNNKPRMEEIGATIHKYQPLQVLWRRSYAHAR